MKKMLVIAAAVVGGSIAMPAAAQEAQPFAGAHVGVEAGWGRVAGGSRYGGDGFTYGANLGYDLAAGKVRFGPEVEISDSTQKTCRTGPAAAGGVRVCERSDRDLYAGGRLGYVVSPKVLVYAKAGYTNARFSTRIDAAGTRNDDGDRDRSGYRVGGGAEYAITRAVYVTGEYRYSHWSSDLHANQILGGVGLRF
jgi:outer membrane immunogenic protein